MNNMGAWGGPLDMQWITAQRDLQLQILAAMRAYGMTPALPGWSGRVPHAILGALPSLQLFQLPSWAGFNSTYSSAWNVDPTDPAFVTLGVRYTNMTMQAYGTDHLWQADLYNEMDPASDGERLSGYAAFVREPLRHGVAGHCCQCVIDCPPAYFFFPPAPQTRRTCARPTPPWSPV